MFLNKYEELLQNASENNVRVYESFDLNGDENVTYTIDGLYIDGNIALDKNLETSREKSCVLAEELGHHHTSIGNIIDINSVSNRKQERQARLWGYNKMIGLRGLIRAFEHGCTSKHEIAEYLDVTTEFLNDAITIYREKYGVCITVDNYIIYFIPYLAIMEKI